MKKTAHLGFVTKKRHTRQAPKKTRVRHESKAFERTQMVNPKEVPAVPEVTPINIELEGELSKIQDIRIFGSVLTKPLDKAGDIDLALGRELTATERKIIQGISNRYNKVVEVFQADPMIGLMEEQMASKQVFSPRKKPVWKETFVGKDFFFEAREPKPPAVEVIAKEVIPILEDVIGKKSKTSFHGQRIVADLEQGIWALNRGSIDGAIATIEETLGRPRIPKTHIESLNQALTILQQVKPPAVEVEK